MVINWHFETIGTTPTFNFKVKKNHNAWCCVNVILCSNTQCSFKKVEEIKIGVKTWDIGHSMVLEYAVNMYLHHRLFGNIFQQNWSSLRANNPVITLIPVVLSSIPFPRQHGIYVMVMVCVFVHMCVCCVPWLENHTYSKSTRWINFIPM